MKYCKDCGTKLEVRTDNIAWFCPSCKRHLYANPVPAVDVMFFDEEGRILLGTRKHMPGKGFLNLPGGFTDPNETIEDGLKREIKEELGLNPSDYGTFTYANSRVHTYTQEGTNRQLIILFFASTLKHQDFAPNDEVDSYVWMLPSELTPKIMDKGEYKQLQEAVKLLSRD